MSLLKEQAAACGPECGCHAGAVSRRTGRLVGALILVAGAALGARAVMRGSEGGAQSAQAAFSGPLPQQDLVSTAVSTASSDPAPKAVEIKADLRPGMGPMPARASEMLVGRKIAALADLNTVATDVDAVLVFLPAKGSGTGETPSAPMRAAAEVFERQGVKVDLFTLNVQSPDHDQMATQIALPGVLALVKGRGMSAVSGQITETKLVQGLVAASRGGSCCPGSGSCQ